MTIAFKGSHFERDVILCGVRWYVAHPISYRQLEEMMEERGVEPRFIVGSSNMYRLWSRRSWRASRPVGGSWQLDETYVRVKGAWKYLKDCNVRFEAEPWFDRSTILGAEPPG